MLRQALFPLPSKARTVRVLVPTARGMDAAVQSVVPEAAPEAPVELLQATVWRVPPGAAAAVPRSVMVASEVETMVSAGEVIRSDGGGEGAGGLETGASCRVT